MDILEDIIEESSCKNKEDKNKEKVYDIKKIIEERYKRLEKKERRPSLEYVSLDDIRDVFTAYDISFSELNDNELRRVYDEWIKDVMREKLNPS